MLLAPRERLGIVGLARRPFLMVLPQCPFGQVQQILTRLKPLDIDLERKKVSFTFSAGWTDYRAGEPPEELLRRADDALYVDKPKRTRLRPPEVLTFQALLPLRAHENSRSVARTGPKDTTRRPSRRRARDG